MSPQSGCGDGDQDPDEPKAHYTTLGVPEDASAEIIKKAYREKAIQHHPDRHVRAGSEVQQQQEDIFKQVQVAFRVLSDPTAKAKYDRELSREREEKKRRQEQEAAAERARQEEEAKRRKPRGLFGRTQTDETSKQEDEHLFGHKQTDKTQKQEDEHLQAERLARENAEKTRLFAESKEREAADVLERLKLAEEIARSAQLLYENCKRDAEAARKKQYEYELEVQSAHYRYEQAEKLKRAAEQEQQQQSAAEKDQRDHAGSREQWRFHQQFTRHQQAKYEAYVNSWATYRRECKEYEHLNNTFKEELGLFEQAQVKYTICLRCCTPSICRKSKPAAPRAPECVSNCRRSRRS